MKKLKISSLVLILSCLLACESEPNKNEIVSGDLPLPVQELLIGEWKNSSLTLVIDNDVDSTLILNSENWVDILGIQPIVSEFRKDSSYLSTYYSPEGEEIMTSSGIWYVEGDSLFMIEREIPNAYHVRLEGNTAYFRGYIDWDQDGISDDLYEGVQERQ